MAKVPEWIEREPLPSKPTDQFRERVLAIQRASETAAEIDDEAELESSVARLREIKQLAGTIEEFIEPFRASARAHLETILERKRELLGPLQAAEAAEKGRVGAWHEKEREREREERKRLLQEATDAAAAEREREIEQAREAGEVERADRLETLPVRPDPAALEREPASATAPEGIQTRTTWKAAFAGEEEESIRELCRAIADGAVGARPELVKVNWTEAHKLARAHKAELGMLGLGLVARSETNVAVRKG